jgi:hypothetical protein
MDVASSLLAPLMLAAAYIMIFVVITRHVAVTKQSLTGTIF